MEKYEKFLLIGNSKRNLPPFSRVLYHYAVLVFYGGTEATVYYLAEQNPGDQFESYQWQKSHEVENFLVWLQKITINLNGIL